MTNEMINAYNAIDGYANQLKFELTKSIQEYEVKNPGWKFAKLDCKIDENGTYRFTPIFKKSKT